MIEIEQAIINKLKVDMEYLKAVAPVGELLLKQLPDDLTIMCPAVYVSFSGASFSPCGVGNNYWETMTYVLSIIGKTYTSTQSLLHGTSTKRGVYHVIEDIFASLNASRLDLDYISPLIPGNLTQEHVDRNVAVFSWEFTLQRRV